MPKDWSIFKLKIYVQASREQIYELLTTRNGLELWFLRQAEFVMPNGKIREGESRVQPGDTYNWLWYGYPDTVAETGEVLICNDNELFSFRFGNAGVVSFQLKNAGHMTEIMLTQSDIPTDDESKMNYHVGCSNGWTFYLANIKSIMEHGNDLRNKSLEYTNVINA